MSGTFICRATCHGEAIAKYPDQASQTVSLNNYFELPTQCTLQLKEKCPNFSRRSGEKICRACAKFIVELSVGTPDKKRKATSPPQAGSSAANPCDTFDKILDDVSNYNFSRPQMESLLHVLGKKLGPDFSKFMMTNVGACIELMSSDLPLDSWNMQYPPLYSFLKGIIEANNELKDYGKSQSDLAKQESHLLHSMETIYGTLNAKYISPLVLSEMLYIYFLSKSGNASHVHGAASGCGSYSTLVKTLGMIGHCTPFIPTDGYIVVAYDNNQVLGKTYRVELQGKFRANVITTVAAFGIENQGNPQCLPLTFHNRAKSEEEKDSMIRKMLKFHSESNDFVEDHTRNFLQMRLEAINQPGRFSRTDIEFVDYVDGDGCTLPERVGMEYTEVETRGYACKIYDQPCLPVNPNSYKGVAAALQYIQSSAINERRKWVTVVADGLPYSLGLEVVSGFVICPMCKEGFMESVISEHFNQIHKQAAPTSFQRFFGNLLLRPGAGHYEMNILKSIFSEWFPIFIEPVAELLGFRSPKAKMFCASASDHHKSWQIFEIVFESLLDEVLTEFLRFYYFTMKSDVTGSPTVEDFWRIIRAGENEYVKGACTFLLEICYPLVLFRAGIRQCNFDTAIKARETASTVFYAFRHPKYQKINCVDVAELIQVPTNIRSAVFNESFRIPGSTVGQGIDFLLEQRNKQLKKFVVHSGVPTTDQWLQASKSLPRLEEIISSVENRLEGLHMDKPSTSHSFAEEKRAARRLFRSSGFLNLSQPQKLVTWGFVEVSEDFVNCKTIAKANQQNFYSDFIKDGKAVIKKSVEILPNLKPWMSWTVARLREEIKSKSLILTEDVRKEFIYKLGQIRKDELRERYERLLDVVAYVDEDVDYTVE